MRRRLSRFSKKGGLGFSFFFWVSWKFSQDSRLLLNQGGHIPRTCQWALGFFSGLRVWTKVPNLSYNLLCLISYRSYTFNMIHRTCIWHFRSKFQANFWFRPFWIYVSSDFSACPQNRVWCLKLKNHSKNQKKNKKWKLPPKGGGLVKIWDPLHDPGHGEGFSGVFRGGCLSKTSQAEEKELWIGGELPNRDKAGWWVGFNQRFPGTSPLQLLPCRGSFLITMGYTKNFRRFWCGNGG